MNKSSKKICFFYPHKQKISGGLLYFYWLATKISVGSDYQSYVLNYQGHPINERFKNEASLNILNYEDECSELDNDTVFFVYLNMLPLLLRRFGHLNKAKIYIVAFHVKTWDYLFRNLSIKREEDKKKIASIIHQHNALVFMDDINLEISNQSAYCNFPQRYVPAFLTSADCEVEVKTIVSHDSINIAYIGRLDRDKIEQTLNFLKNANLLKSDKRINAHVIGDGDSAYRINKDDYPNINIIWQRDLSGVSLQTYLRQNVDFVVAMGMGCLEAAALKLPAVMPVFDSRPHHINKYFLLCELSDYFLGGPLKYMERKGWRSYSLQELTNMIYAEDGKILLGEKSYNYFIQNHSIDRSVLLFLEYMNSTTLTIGEMLKNKNMLNHVNNFLWCSNRDHPDYDDFLMLRKRNKHRILFRLSYRFKACKIFFRSAAEKFKKVFDGPENLTCLRNTEDKD